MTEARDRDGNEFGSAKWRSPLTRSTSAEILVKRQLFWDNCWLVNKQVISMREEKARIAAELEAKA